MSKASGLPFAVLGITSVVVGGLIAAISRPLEWSYGSWVSAYLVLVTGAAQLVLGLGQDSLTDRTPDCRTIAVEIGGINVGSAAVIAGTLASLPWIVDLGGLLILVALTLALIAIRGVPNTVIAGLYRLVIVIVIVSIPVGLTLSHMNVAGS